MKRIILILLAASAMVSCSVLQQFGGSQKRSQYTGMYEEKPNNILVMPPINKSNNVDAKDLFFTTVGKPLAESGYYVLSPLIMMDVLRNESAYDAEMFVDSDLGIFKKILGADALLFTEILTWTKKGIAIETDIRYFIRSTVTGETLFDRTCNLILDTTSSSGNSLTDLALGLIKTATTEPVEAARKANAVILQDIPRGKYDPSYMKDQDFKAEKPNVTKIIKK